MASPSTYRSSEENAKLGTRLDCWKEIAAYLGKVDRTVKRWDASRGLPIHRVPGGGHASVYAYTAELDEWLKATKAQELEATLQASQEDDAPEESSGRAIDLANASAMVNAPAMANFRVPETSAPRSVLVQNWLLAICGLLLAAVAGVPVFSAGIRTTSQRLSHTLQGLFAKSHVASEPRASIAVSDSEKSQARDLYLKGRYEWNQRTPDSLNRALDDFTQAIVHDPGYAQAYVGMADTYDLLREYSTMPESDAYTRSIAAAKKAIELDDSLADAHRALAFAESWGKWDFADGEKEFRRAIELNPNDPIARNWYANVLLIQGRFSEALEENAKARDLDPSSHSILADRGNMLFYAGKRDEGIAMLKDVEAAYPNLGSPHSYLMKINLGMRDYPAFLAEGKKTAETRNDSVLRDIVASAQAGYAQHGGGGLLNNLYARQKEYYLAGKYSGATLAETCVLMGKKQEGLQLLEEGYDRRDMFVLSSAINPVLFTLRDEPRYEVLLAKLDFHLTPGQPSPNAPAKSDISRLRAASDPH